MNDSLRNQPGLDTALARLLHQAERVPLVTLRDLLSVSRAARPEAPTLATLLVEHGHISDEEAERGLRELSIHAAPQPADSELKPPGRRFGPYEIERKLGSGGMGSVFLVRHVESRAHYGLKLLAASDSESLLRFQREAEAMVAAEGHPNVARIHTVGESNGRPYIVMEHLPGQDLGARLQEGPLQPEEAVSLIRQLADGLAWVHDRGVLHRDLKPSNVLFAEDGTPRLIDFGIARLDASARLTKTGMVMGTPSHMAPEQALGDRAGVDERTDVFGLGALLYHCLTGSAPFGGGSYYEILDSVVMKDPIPPSKLQPKLSRQLDAICKRALAKKPADRYPSAGALREALNRYALGLPIEGEPAARRWLPLAALGLLSFGISAAVMWPRASAPSPEPSPPPTVVATTSPAPTPSSRPNPTLRPLHVFDQAKKHVGIDSPVSAVLLPGEKRFLTWGADMSIRVWSSSSGLLSEHEVTAFPSGLILAPDGGGVFVGYVGSWFVEYRSLSDLSRPLKTRALRLPLKSASALAARPRVEIAAAAIDGTNLSQIRVFHSTSGATLNTIPVPGIVNDLALSQNRLVVVSGKPSPRSPREILLWREAPEKNGQPPEVRVGLAAPGLAAAISPDESFFAVGSDRVSVFHVNTGMVPLPLEGRESESAPGPVRGVAFSPDGELLLSTRGSGLVLWDLNEPLAPRYVETVVRDGELRSVRFSSSGEYVFLGLLDGKVEVWSADVLRDRAELGSDSIRDPVYALHRQAAHEFLFGSKRKAHALLDQAIELSPRFAPSLFLRGRLHHERDDVARAERDFTRVLEVLPELDSAYERRARVKARGGGVESVIADTSRALELNPNRTACYLMRGRILKQLSRLREGEADLRQVIERLPDWSQEHKEAEALLGQQ